MESRGIRLLLVEDNPADVRLTEEVLNESDRRIQLDIVSDGDQCIRFLRQEDEFKDKKSPDLILLDWNLPKKNGEEVLAEIKADSDLCRIPVVVVTSSSTSEDITRAYELQASCFITKPIDQDQFIRVVRIIEDFWLDIVKLPDRYRD